FYLMKMRGRKVYPWFNTAFAISLSGTITITLFFFLFIKKNILSENVFLLFFCILLILIFLIVRSYFIRGGLELVTQYLEKYSETAKRKNRTISVCICIFSPIILGFLLWLKATD
ncbi:MAG: hypothetical protein ACXVBH_11625, partial [Flavisolibacter sp.]